MKKMFGFFAVVFALVCGMIMGEAREASAAEFVSDEEMDFYCETIEELCIWAYENDVDDYASSNVIYKVFWRPVEDDQSVAYVTLVGVIDGKMVVVNGQVDRFEFGCLAAEMLSSYTEYVNEF